MPTSQPLYEVVSCSRNNSYRIKPHGGPGLILQRHFNELERAPHQVLRWENTPPSPPSGFSSDDEGVPPRQVSLPGTAPASYDGVLVADDPQPTYRWIHRRDSTQISQQNLHAVTTKAQTGSILSEQIL